MFFTLSRTDMIVLATLNLPSANAFNLVKAKLLAFGEDLTDVYK